MYKDESVSTIPSLQLYQIIMYWERATACVEVLFSIKNVDELFTGVFDLTFK